MRLRPAFITITSVSFLSGMAMQLIVSTLPLYIEALGMQPSTAGYLMGGYVLASLAARPFGGRLCDRLGRRPVMIFGSALYALASAGFLFFKSIWLIALLRVLQGAGYSVLTTAAAAVAADLLPKERLSKGIGYYGVAKSVSLAVAPALGLFLLERYGGHLLFAAVLAISALSCALTIFQKGTREACRKEKKMGSKKGIWDFLERSSLKAALMQALLTFASASVSVFLPTFFSHRGIGYAGIYLAVSAGGMIAARLLLGGLLEKGGVRMSVLPACALLAGAYLLTVFGASFAAHCAGAAIFGAGQGMSMPALNALALKNTPPERHGKASGTYYASLDFGLGVGAVVWGALSVSLGFEAVYIASAALCCAAGVTAAFPTSKNGHAAP